MDKLSPRGLYAEGLANGQYVVQVTSGRVTGWVAVPATGVATVVAGTYIKVNATDPQNVVVTAMVPVTTLVGGVPQIVFDDDGHLVYTEAP